MIFSFLYQFKPRNQIFFHRYASNFSQKVESLAIRAKSGCFYREIDVTKSSCNTVLLLHPPGACSAFTRSGSQYPPLGLLQLKAVIGDSSKVDVLEADGLGLCVDETVDTIRDTVPKAIGMTITCGTKGLTDAWSTIVKNINKSYRPLVLVGGPAAAFETDSILSRCPQVDVVVKGEGEATFPRIVDILHKASENQSRQRTLSMLSKIPGVCVRNMPYVNDTSIPILSAEAFKTLPFPDLSNSPVASYKAPDATRLPMVTMMTQRGCIAKCAFCNTPQIHGQKIRGWSNDQILEELIHLKNEYGVREISFVDDVFTNRPGGGPRKLCEMMIEKQLGLTWYCNVRADQVTPKMAAAMKEAGCHQVFIGFESGCDQILERINKGERVKDLERGAAILKDAGINISIGFIVGLPGETRESVQKTISLCNRVKPHRVQFTRYTPIPGSPLAATHLVEGHGFHDRSRTDQIEAWIQECYIACPYRPSL